MMSVKRGVKLFAGLALIVGLSACGCGPFGLGPCGGHGGGGFGGGYAGMQGGGGHGGGFGGGMGGGGHH